MGVRAQYLVYNPLALITAAALSGILRYRLLNNCSGREPQTFGRTSTSSYSIGTAGGVSGVWVLFVKLLPEDYPNMFGRIEVR